MSLEILKTELLAAIKRGAAQQRLVDASKTALDTAVSAGLVKTASRCHARWVRQLKALDDSKAEIDELKARIDKEAADAAQRDLLANTPPPVDPAPPARRR